MLPPGHLAAGFLVSEALLKITKPNLPQSQLSHLLWWGIFFSFAPDLDAFIAFIKVGAWWYKPSKDSSVHRKFYSHAPMLWLAVSVCLYMFSNSEYAKYFAIMVFVGSFTHFILDSIEYGIMWLWPFNTEVWAIGNRGVKRYVQGKNFLDYWINVVKAYTGCWTFKVEVALLIFALIYLNFYII